MDAVLADYIFHASQSDFTSLWETRCFIACRKIKTTEIRADSLIYICQHHSLPWPETLLQLVNGSQKIVDKFRQNALQEQVNLMYVKQLFARQNISSEYLSNQESIELIMKNLLSTDDKRNFEDALVLLDAYPFLSKRCAFIQFLKTCIKKENSDAIYWLLNDAVEENMAESCADEVMCWLSYHCDKEWCDKGHALVSNFLAQLHVRNQRSINDCRILIELRQFGIDVTAGILYDQKGTHRIIHDFVLELLLDKNCSCTFLSQDYRVLRACELLEISHLEMCEILVSVSIMDRESIVMSLELCEHLVTQYGSLADVSLAIIPVLGRVTSEMIDMKAIPARISARIYDRCKILCARCWSISKGTNATQLLDQFQKLELLNILFDNTEYGDYSVMLRAPTRIEYTSFEQFVRNDHVYAKSSRKDQYVDQCSLLNYERDFSVILKGLSPSRDACNEVAIVPLRSPINIFTEARMYTAAMYLQRLSKESTSLRQDLVISILHSALSRKTIDPIIVTTCLLSLTDEKIHDIITDAQRQYEHQIDKCGDILDIGLVIFMKTRFNAVLTSEFESLIFSLKWKQKLQEHGVKTSASVSETIQELFGKSLFEIAVQYGVANGLDRANVGLQYIEHVLKKGVFDRSSYESNQVVSLCQEFSGNEPIKSLLADILRLVSPYDYERISFILEIRCDLINSEMLQMRKVLDIVESYDRVAPPSSRERISVCMRMNLANQVAANSNDFYKTFTESLKRLPIHELIAHPDIILAIEFTMDSLSTIVRLCAPLAQSTDMAYMYFIKTMLPEIPKKNISVECLERIVLKIVNVDSGTNAWLQLAKAFPVGDKRIEYYNAAMVSAARNNDTSEMQDIANLRIRSGLERVLQKNHLDEFIHLVSRPDELLIQLFDSDHMDVEGSMTSSQIKEVADFIESSYGLDVRSLMLSVMRSWIRSKQWDSAGASLHRMETMVKMWPVSEQVQLLISLASDKSSSFSDSARIRCLQTVVKVASRENIEQHLSFEHVK